MLGIMLDLSVDYAVLILTLLLTAILQGLLLLEKIQSILVDCADSITVPKLAIVTLPFQLQGGTIPYISVAYVETIVLARLSNVSLVDQLMEPSI
jgi:hypothetical protein